MSSIIVAARWTGKVARVYNSCMSATGFVAERTMSTREVRELWFGYSTFDPREYAMAVSGGRVLGIVFACVRPLYRSYVWMCPDMEAPPGIRVEAVSSCSRGQV